MNIQTIEKNGIAIAVVNSTGKAITDVQSALDFIMSVTYETGSSRIALNQEAMEKLARP